MVSIHQRIVLWLAVVAASLGVSTGTVRGQSGADGLVNGGDNGAKLTAPEELPTPELRLQDPVSEHSSVRAYEIHATAEDHIVGRLRIVDPYTGVVRAVRATDVMIIQEGSVVSRSRTGAEGMVEFDDVPAGKSSVIAVGPDGLAAFGVSVLPEVASGGHAANDNEGRYHFDVLLVPGIDVTVAQHSICVGDDQTIVPEPSRFDVASPIGFPSVMVAGKAKTEGEMGPARLASLTAGSFPGDFGADASRRRAAAPLKGQPILIRNGDTGVGQLIIPGSESGEPAGLANADVSFIRRGKIVEHVQTDDAGHCRVSGLDDGVYSMVGVGENGFIALGVRVTTAAASTPSRPRVAGREVAADFVSTMPYGGSCCQWRVAGAQTSALAYAPGFTCGGCGQVGCCGSCGLGPAGGPCGPVAGGPAWGCCGMGGYGGFGGGYGAFGGGGFGGGGLAGALVGAGLGAAIGAAIAASNDDDDNDPGDPGDPATPVVPIPASPFLPPK